MRVLWPYPKNLREQSLTAIVEWIALVLLHPECHYLGCLPGARFRCLPPEARRQMVELARSE